MRLKEFRHEGQSKFYFWCPACQRPHPFTVKPDGSAWTFNGSWDKPTFFPSLRVVGSGAKTLCHLFLKEGMLIYCSDCPHKMAGQTVPLPDLPDLWGD